MINLINDSVLPFKETKPCNYGNRHRWRVEYKQALLENDRSMSPKFMFHVRPLLP